MGFRKNFTLWLVAIGLWGSMVSASAQIYSQHIVGYYNLLVRGGDNLVANQLVSSSDTLSNLFQYAIPEGSTFTKWDPTANQYLAVSTYLANTGWSINYGLTVGEGGLFNSPILFTNTFVGYVLPEINPNGSFTLPVISATGLLLLSCAIPINNAGFNDVVGRDPQDGEYVTLLNALTQSETTTVFQDGTWNNGIPLLNIGQSAFFNLQAVPEPTALALLGTSAVLVVVFSKKRIR